jgi:hypothetical protein
MRINLGGYAGINVSNLGPNDEVLNMSFTVDSAEGSFFYDGAPLADGTYVYGNVTITVTTDGSGNTKATFTPTPPATGLTESDLADISGKFGMGTADGNHSNKDIDIDWDYTVRDTQSGDTAGKTGGEKVVINAVAHEPEVMDYIVDYGTGKEAALPGENISVTAKVEFM